MSGVLNLSSYQCICSCKYSHKIFFETTQSDSTRATIAESEAMPLRYAAELLGMGTDDEKAIRWLIALLVLCCDPLAIALTAAVSARRSTSG
jgi:hypothetical protein